MASFVTVARWIVRVVGTVIAAILFVCIVVPVLFGGGNNFDPLGQLLRGKVFFAAILTTVIGLVIATKWEIIGGLLRRKEGQSP